MYEKKIAVRSLVEFIYRQGNLDLRFQSKAKAHLGTQIHQEIQSKQDHTYTPEVFLSEKYAYFTELGEVVIHISGRADGIIKDDEGITIDEIKTTSQNLDEIKKDSYPVHWAQAKIYAYIYGYQEALDFVNVRLTYVHQGTKEKTYYKESYTFKALENFYKDTLEAYEKWVTQEQQWYQKRQKSIRALKFPYGDYRKGQRELSIFVYKGIKEGFNGFIEAPTGIGKSMSTLFPAIKSMGEDHIQRLFFLSAKTVTQKAAVEALADMRGANLKMKSLCLTAKDKLCPLDKVACYPEKCNRAKGHFDRVNDAVWEVINDEKHLDKECIEKISEKHCVCPYEFSLDASVFMDVIIGDYNYAFDPRVYLRRFFENPIEPYALLIDEAHNLVDRSRHMYSATLSKENIMTLRRKTKDQYPHLYKVLHQLNQLFLKIRKKCDENGLYVDKDEIDEVYTHIKNKMVVFEKWLQEKHGAPIYEDVLEMYFELNNYLRISELYDEGFLTYIKKTKEDTLLKLFCIDPSRQIKSQVEKSQSAHFFTATFNPMNYYFDLLGGKEEDKKFVLSSPFPDRHLKVLGAKDVSMKYKVRDKNMGIVCNYILEMIKSKKGNYLVFFPSYKYMNQCYDYINDMAFEENIDLPKYFLMQSSNMDELTRHRFVETFRQEDDVLGFAVMGGMFSEGIDLKGETLIGTMVIGTGIPQINFENNLIRNFFEEQGKNGFQYAYQFPGINKVTQSVGRVIRTSKDRGVAILVDQRFLMTYYKKYLPYHWHLRGIHLNEMPLTLNSFWEENKK